jgi:hypothetical protein
VLHFAFEAAVLKRKPVLLADVLPTAKKRKTQSIPLSMEFAIIKPVTLERRDDPVSRQGLSHFSHGCALLAHVAQLAEDNYGPVQELGMAMHWPRQSMVCTRPN